MFRLMLTLYACWSPSLAGEVVKTQHLEVRAEDGVTVDLAAVAAGAEASLGRVTQRLGLATPDEPIVVRIEAKEPGERPGAAKPMANEVRVSPRRDLPYMIEHELVHVVARQKVGASHERALVEGLAVMVVGRHHGDPLEPIVANLARRGKLPSVEEMFGRFREIDSARGYPAAGHLCGFIRDTWGMQALLRIYKAKDAPAQIKAETGLTLAELDAKWKASIKR